MKTVGFVLAMLGAVAVFVVGLAGMIFTAPAWVWWCFVLIFGAWLTYQTMKQHRQEEP